MTQLREKMRQELILRGCAQKTQDSYLGCVSRLAKFYHKRPDQLNDEDIRQYTLHLIETKNISEKTLTVNLCAFRFFYEKTLRQPKLELGIIRAKKRKKLPVVLSEEEVRMILENITPDNCKMALKMAYACGLRVSEAANLRTDDICRKRMVLRITGKGGKDREVPLPVRSLHLLEDYWRIYRPSDWLFPSRVRKGLPISEKTLQRAFKLTVRQHKVRKDATCHSLRHSFATHLLDVGVDIQALQKALGHSSIKSTLVYLHLTHKRRSHFKDSVNELMSDL